MIELRVSVATHYFVASGINPRARPAVDDFARSLIQWSWRPQRRGPAVRVADKVFAASTRYRNEHRFHINLLEKFKEQLRRYHINDTMVLWNRIPLTIEPEVDFELATDALEPRDYQVPVIDYIVKPEGPRSRLVDLQTGKGKSLPLGAKIKIPGGWSTMGEMKVGTEVVAWDGTTTKVTGVYPQGIRSVYRLTFADGRSTEADEEHLWEVYYVNTVKHRRWRIVNTLEVLRLISMPNPRVYVRLIKPEIGTDIDLPIPPYTLGAILGDGCLRATSISVSKADKEVFQNIQEELLENHKLVKRDQLTWVITSEGKPGYNLYLNGLRELGLVGSLSHSKFVPEQYLHASVSQRLSLVQGLLDTDGTVGKDKGSVSYSTTSESLAKSTQYLIRSLGGIASISSKIPTYTHLDEKKNGRLAYQVNIRHPEPSELFRLPRKKELTNDDNQYSSKLKLAVKSVEYVGEKETQCISVEHPDRLYVTDDFIVTHNTFCALRAVSIFNKRAVAILKPKYIHQWIQEVKIAYNIKDKEICAIHGKDAGKQFISLLNMAAAGELPYKFIIISNAVYRNWISLYEEHYTQILDMGYACLPQDFFAHVKAGLRLIDEVHEDFHFNFKLDLYTNVERSLSLSATLLSDNPFIQNMMKVAYPPDKRYIGGDYDKYVKSYYLLYKFKNPEKIKTSFPGNNSYSHFAFEESIIKQPKVLENYFVMIKTMMEETYFRNYRPGQRCLIYCASIDMCTRLVNWLKREYPNKDIRRFVEDDPDENVKEAEISVSTVGSAGTGLDIKMLATVILTHAIRSSQSNIQGFGRLRKPKDGWTPEFIYAICEDVIKHLDYHDEKDKLLAARALSNEKRMYMSLI